MKNIIMLLAACSLAGCGGGDSKNESSSTPQVKPLTPSIPIVVQKPAIASRSVVVEQKKQDDKEVTKRVASPLLPIASKPVVVSKPVSAKPVSTKYQPVLALANLDTIPFAGSNIHGVVDNLTDKTVVATFAINGKIDAQCNVNAQKNVCSYTIKKENEGKKLDFCVTQEGGTKTCESATLPRISFSGHLNYGDQITAHLDGFDLDNLQIDWILTDEKDVDLMSQSVAPGQNNRLTYDLHNDLNSAEDYIHKFLHVCINDHATSWKPSCYLINAHNESIQELVGFSQNTSAEIVSGGEIFDNDDSEIGSNVIQYRVGPKPYVISYITDGDAEKLYRPITAAEFEAFGYALQNNKNRYKGYYPEFELDRTVHELQDNDVRDRKIIDSVINLCSTVGLSNYASLGAFKRAETDDLGWPKGYYWLRNSPKNKWSSYIYDMRTHKIDDILNTTESLVSCSIRY